MTRTILSALLLMAATDLAADEFIDKNADEVFAWAADPVKPCRSAGKNLVCATRTANGSKELYVAKPFGLHIAMSGRSTTVICMAELTYAMSDPRSLKSSITCPPAIPERLFEDGEIGRSLFRKSLEHIQEWRAASEPAT